MFSSVNAVETKVENDSITVEIRIREDEKATIKKVSVSGNDKTNDHVLFRELRVKPGDLFSRSAIIRSIREIGQLGFFDQNVTPDVIQITKTKQPTSISMWLKREEVKLNSKEDMEEDPLLEPSDCLLTTFSFRNMFNKAAYKPLPMGDGQTLSIRLQSSRTFNTYSFSFSEPWLGGKKPKSLSFSIYSSNQYQINPQTFEVDRRSKFRNHWSLLRLRATFDSGPMISFNYHKALVTKVSI